MKKILCILLSLLILVTVLTGCSDNKKQEEIGYEITLDTHYKDIDESVQRGYEKIATAVLDYDSEVKFNITMIDDVIMLFYTSSPFNSLVSKIDILDDKSGVSIEYKNDIDTHKQLINDFNSKISDIMNECDYNKVSVNLFIINLYNYIVNNFTIDNSNFNLVDAVINNKGAGAVINSLFEYIILRAGGSAMHVINYTGSAIILSLAKFNGKWYYFSPADEITSGKKALKYFGMNEARIHKLAVGAFSFTDQTIVDITTDDTYGELDRCVSYELNGKKLVATLDDNSSEEFDIK